MKNAPRELKTLSRSFTSLLSNDAHHTQCIASLLVARGEVFSLIIFLLFDLSFSMSVCFSVYLSLSPCVSQFHSDINISSFPICVSFLLCFLLSFLLSFLLPPLCLLPSFLVCASFSLYPSLSPLLCVSLSILLSVSVCLSMSMSPSLVSLSCPVEGESLELPA